jgi:hypothetical protein
MSIAKAFLMGAVKGGLKENNQRARRMEERMLALADNNAAMSRERAQSQYDNTSKAAASISSTQAGLIANNFIDPSTGEYTKQYYDNEAYLEWKDPEVRKAHGGDGGEKVFKEQYSKLIKKKAFVNPYKSAQERDADLTKLHRSISARQQVESSQPVLTGIDKLLMKGADSAINTIGDGARAVTEGAVDIQSGMTPRPSQEVPALAESSPMAAQVPQKPEKPYVSPVFNTAQAGNVLTQDLLTQPAYDKNTQELLSGVIKQEIKGPLGGTRVQYIQRNDDGSETDITSNVVMADASGDDVRSSKNKEKPRDSFVKQMTALVAANDAFTTIMPTNEGIMQGIDSGLNWLDTMFTFTNDPARIAAIKGDAMNKYNLTLNSVESIKEYAKGEETKRLYKALGYTSGQDSEVDRIVTKTLSNVNDTYFIYKGASALRGDTAKELNTMDIKMLKEIVEATGVKAKQTVFKTFATKFKMSSIDTARNAVSNFLGSEGDASILKNLTFAKPSVLQPKDIKSGMPSGVAFYVPLENGKFTTVFMSQSGQVEKNVNPNMLAQFYELMP